MEEIRISDKISYIEASDDPLSSDIGIYRDNNSEWLFDVGCGKKSIASLTGTYNVVLSHFHQDHTGNIDRVRFNELFVSATTFGHVHCGGIISKETVIGNLRIFPLPSSHARGCLGLEIESTYAFVGDALYCKFKDGHCLYNAQFLKDEIGVLKNLSAPYLLVSHYKGLVRSREEVLTELETIYGMRDKDDPIIRL